MREAKFVLKKVFHQRWLSCAIAFLAALGPSSLWACACGCGMFEVGTNATLPLHEGGIAFLEYDFVDQNKNWHNSSSAPSENNEDKRIKSHFITAGAQYMFNRKWGMMATVPYWDRTFRTTDEDENVVEFHHSSLGDIRLKGIYTGFDPDMSMGLTFGVKLPSGDYKDRDFDRDTSIGTGSTDLLLGAYRNGSLTADNRWTWFVNGEWDEPILITPNYRPGAEVNVSLGSYFNGWRLGNVNVAPVAQAIGSQRWSDTGDDANHQDSGYQRLVLAPGLDFRLSQWRLYAEVGFPVYQNVNGNQLVATDLFKINISRSF